MHTLLSHMGTFDKFVYIIIYNMYACDIYIYMVALYLHMFLCYMSYTMGPGPGLVAHVLWRYCMRLASSGVGVGGVRRVRLALLYVGNCVGVLWMMFWMRLASSGVWGGCIGHRVPSEG